MSIAKNLSNLFMPHFESRRSTATINSLNAEIVHNVDGDESASIFINGTGTANATYEVNGSADGTNFYPILTFPHSPASLGGTLPHPAQPIYTEAVNAATVTRLLCVGVGQIQKIRVRLTAYTTGSFAITINSDAQTSLSPYVRDQKAASLMVTATAATGIAATASLPAVTGLRHYIDRISVVRSLTAAQTAGAAPTVVTTTNLPGTPALTFGVDAGAQGADKEFVFDFGGAGIGAIAPATATTIVCPATTSVIWRVNVSYRLGL